MASAVLQETILQMLVIINLHYRQKSTFFRPANSRAWIGATKVGGLMGTCAWSDSSPWNFPFGAAPWGGSQPDFGGDCCLSIWNFAFDHMNDEPCLAINYFFCQV
jgi:hypothetical protein